MDLTTSILVGAAGLFGGLVVFSESPQLIFQNGKLCVNRWVHKKLIDLSDISEIEAGIVKTGGINPHRGLYIYLKSGKILKYVCDPESDKNAIDYFQPYRA